MVGRSCPNLVYVALKRYITVGVTKEYAFEEFCQIVGAVAARDGILRVYLFGSRARSDNIRNSDENFCNPVT